MAVHDVTPSVVQHDSGAQVGGVDRQTMYYELGGRRLLLPVDRGDTYGFNLPAAPRWSDGSVVSEDELATVRKIVSEACAHWGIRAQFYRADPTAPPVSITDIADMIRRARPDA